MAASLLGRFGGKASHGPHRRLSEAPQAQVRHPPPPPHRRPARRRGPGGLRPEHPRRPRVPRRGEPEGHVDRRGPVLPGRHRTRGGPHRGGRPLLRVRPDPVASRRPCRSFEPPANRKRERVQKLRQVLLHHGFDEVINFSFSDPEKEAALGSGREPVAIRNPLSARSATMRTTLIMGLLENAARNLNRGLEGVHIFEVGQHLFPARRGLRRTALARAPRHGPAGRAPLAVPAGDDGLLRPQGGRRGGDDRPALRAVLLRGDGPSVLRDRGVAGPRLQGREGRLPRESCARP